MASLSTPTPRRGYFSIPDSENVALLNEEKGTKGSTEQDEGEGIVPPTPSTVAFLEKREYRDAGIIPVKQIFGVTLLGFFILFLLVLLGKDWSAHTLAMSSSETALLPSNLLEQCKRYQGGAKGNGTSAVHDYFHQGHHKIEERTEWTASEVDGECASTLTYLLDSDHGLFYHLSGLLQAYSLAALSNRTFFIDDSLWDRGVWEDHFEPLPEQLCARPSVEKMRSCPRGSRHWVLSANTLDFHFGREYQAAFEDPTATKVWRLKPMYELARKAFDEILIPSQTNQYLIDLARKSLMKTNVDSNGTETELEQDYLGVHLRRGDRHPMEQKWSEGYLPWEYYTEAIYEIWLHASAHHKEMGDWPLIWLATDSPHDAPLLSDASPKNYNYLTLFASEAPALHAIASPTSYDQLAFHASTTADEKSAQTSGMIVDFALMTGSWGIDTHGGKKPRGVICTVSSNVCRMAAVALGWETAITQGVWYNVDGMYEFDWRPTEVL